MADQEREIPEGFKETEIGLLPVDWEVVKLGEIFSVKQGKALSSKHRIGSNIRPFLRTANVLWGKIILSPLDEMNFTDTEMEQLRLMPGDLLVCEGGDIGRTAVWKGELDLCCYQNHIHRLRSNDHEIYSEFYMYWMQAAFLIFHLYVGAGNKTTIPNLSQARLKAFVLPKPPLSEQRKIAHVLSTIQRAVEQQDKIIAAVRELKKSLMRHLFTYGPVSVDQVDRVSLKETEIGPVPEHWEVVRLCEAITQAQYGLSMRGESTGKYPILRMNNLSDGRVDINSLQYVNLDKNTYSRFRLNKGDILFNRTNSYELVGKTSIFNLSGDYVFASYIIRLVTDDNRLISAFLNYYLNMEFTQNRLKLLATRGVSQSNISATKLKGFLISIPPIFEQKQIANFLTLMDQKINVEEKRKSTLQSLFQAMLHLLMTGRVRVKDLEVTHDETGL